jgi:Xaa-Pro aminopeptidase
VPARRALQPSQSFVRRLLACRQKIQQKSLDGYLITNRADQFYFTGFDGEDGAALVTPRQVYLLTDGRFEQEAAETAPWAQAIIRKGRLSEALAKLATRLRLRQIGFQPEILTVQAHKDFAKALRPARLVPLPGISTDLRIIKDEGEVETIVRAGRIATDAFSRAIRRIRVGMTELELAALLEYEMMRGGASGPSFQTIVAEGPRAALPHARPTNRRINAGSLVLIDWGARVGHYCSDLTRVVFVRRIPPRFRRMYNVVRAAQRAGMEAVRPGARMRDPDAAARAVLRQAGMERAFSHGLGHGLGLDIHEAPRLSSRGPDANDPLKPGMVVTVEPGVYFPGIGGVRIEDDVLVTDQGCRLLTDLPTDIDSMVV